MPGTNDMVKLSDISKSGGEVNAYEAMKLAATLKGDRKMKMDILPRSKVKNEKKG